MGLRAPIDWSAIAPVFAFDGTLRDLYILETTSHDWQAVWDFLRTHESRPTYSVSGVEGDFPAEVAGLLGEEGASHLVSIQLGPMLINCHLWWMQEIEFDLDPREVTGPDAAERLFGFMHGLSLVTGKDVLLAEGHPPDEYLRVTPQGDLVQRPLPFGR